MSHPSSQNSVWRALAIGNSRLHWAQFNDNCLEATWEEPHRQPCTQDFADAIPLWIASVVAQQLQLWQTNAHIRIFTLEMVPIQGMYPTLGIDRALAVWGAGIRYGFPVLVIDAGTALTLTGVDGNRHLRGGAILPGLGLQLKTLAQNTADLPHIPLDGALPERWAKDTVSAIHSGVLYFLLAGLQEFIATWQQQFPHSSIVFTGGDGTFLHDAFRHQFPQWEPIVQFDSHLIFWGMQNLRVNSQDH